MLKNWIFAQGLGVAALKIMFENATLLMGVKLYF